MEDLTTLIGEWPVNNAAVGVTTVGATVAVGGDPTWPTRVASVTKLLSVYAGLIALEEETISLDEPAGPAGSTVEHLMAHASGLAFDSDRLVAAPGSRRVYSNTGIEVLAGHIGDRAGMPFESYLKEGVLDPLEMHASVLCGSPAHAMDSSVADLLAFAREVMNPTLISTETRDRAVEAHFPDLRGVVPGVGSFSPNPWGLGFEIRGRKVPHWTGRTNSPRTHGHFGGSGCFLWIDPDAGLACAAVTDRGFGAWSLAEWVPFSDQVLARYREIIPPDRTTP